MTAWIDSAANLFTARIPASLMLPLTGIPLLLLSTTDTSKFRQRLSKCRPWRLLQHVPATAHRSSTVPDPQSGWKDDVMVQDPKPSRRRDNARANATPHTVPPAHTTDLSDNINDSAGSGPVTRPAWLKAVSGSLLDVLLTRPTIVLGRSTTCDLHVDDPLVSREHFMLTHDHGRWYITDLGTPNGTSVNNRPVSPLQPVELVSGDTVEIGAVQFILTLRGEAPVPLELRTGAATARGGRRRNEDDFFVGDHLLAVADGVGGRPAGDIAAGIAIDLVRTPSRFYSSWTDVVTLIEAALQARGRGDTRATNMATTLDAARLTDRDGVAVMSGVHIGDGIAVLDSGTHIRELTVVHTYGRELAEKHHPEASRHPDRGRLVRGIGLEDAQPDLWEEEAVVGHRYVLSTDGILRALGSRRLTEALIKLRQHPPQTAADTLISLAQQSDVPPEALDNLTVAIADVCRSDQPQQAIESAVRAALPSSRK
ncbi:FHA domain-containing protein [Nocardia asiatica]|uniref:FHA domain-containing protein n=1 Tax=Nocardia asiatica TaxID=209252 RepID=UPI00031CF258|nr:FHA domain-containing protein [Nocardia asiatica]